MRGTRCGVAAPADVFPVHSMAAFFLSCVKNFPIMVFNNAATVPYPFNPKAPHHMKKHLERVSPDKQYPNCVRKYSTICLS